MSWNAPKDKNPWQGGSDSNKPSPQGPQNQQPPDLDEMFRKLFSKFNEAMGGKPNRPSTSWQPPKGLNSIAGIIVGLLVALYI
ncbi:MAG: protease modulator HflK N-terminal domain-containing protein, partial [Gammaproteobacteria bacterium]